MSTFQNPDIIRVLDLSLDLIQIINLDGKILFCSKSSELILGYPADSITGTSILDNVVAEDKAATKEAFLAVREKGKIYNFENRFLNKDNIEIYLSWSLIWDEQTKDTFAIGRNISELKNNEKHYRSLIQNINIGIIIQKQNAEITL